ncbi:MULTISPECIES: sacsin N-terminal ATP-binding-like domain-containing protein [unclassified Rhodococcus (in: high G+C Gram-positive bacteria)]|uniref:sacsin N-terminal ATP-binding-like domain-containing protein n=1 Tax=unclassified Rhodococcus (in: high G+C Gram-positive bacteria) TaxID=192944 RepID=UPI000A405EA4|nr:MULTISPECIES: ATP-binding protein [unclassified Rhodococcus (in: high G+C Gram-positive bacteria)]
MAGGYRDRVVTELAQNAADAASRAGVDGRLSIRHDGTTLRIANVGAPLTVSGVQALSALRASDKDGGSIGRYGVGFTSVRALSDRIEIRSTTGSIVFDAARTRTELQARGLPEPAVGAPVLRLPWPLDEVPADGWDTEIVLNGVGDAAGVVEAAEREAVDLLLELDALASISLHDKDITRSTAPGPGSWTEVRIGADRWWRGDAPCARWFLPLVGGEPSPVRRDVLRAPTRSDEVLTLPLLVVADVPLQPDRRRVLPGADLSTVATGYGDLVAELPAADRTAAVPVPGLPASGVDEELRAAVIDDLEATAWVPTAVGKPVRPADAAVLESISTEFADLLADVVPGLVAADASDRSGTRALISVGSRRLGLAAVVEALSGLSKPPQWWRRIYGALADVVHDTADADECAALPVPLTDGRTVTGPRTVLLVDGVDLGPIGWARVVHPDAAHPLLQRLGAQTVRPADLLADPALAAMLEDPDHVDDDLVHQVLTVAGAVGGTDTAPGLGALPLASSDGDARAADELVLPASPLLAVMVSDHPFGVVADSVVQQYGSDALRVVGVGWTFGTVVDDEPTGPDHDLDDESGWWDSVTGSSEHSAEPTALIAVRDLDLVDESRWAQALTLLVDRPETAAALRDRAGYTPWWLRRHARLQGTPLGLLRLPEDSTFTGLLDPVDHPHAPEFRSALAGVDVDDADTATDILTAAADPERSVSPAVAVTAHRVLAAAAASSRLDVRDVDPPDAVRTLSGTVVDPSRVVVLDHAKWIAVIPPDRAVMGSLETADALADLLDVETASSVLTVDVVSSGVTVVVDDHPLLAAMRAAVTWPVPDVVELHDRLTVRCEGIVAVTRDVPFWITDDGVLHLSGSVI